MGFSSLIFSAFWKSCEKNDNKRIASQTPLPYITAVTDIPYIEDGTRAHLLDVYFPEETKKPLPVIIDIHGGGWMYGYKEINRNYCFHLASCGYTVFSINYRLWPEAVMHEQLSDVFAALVKIKELLPSYPCDDENIFLTGDSAGGQLASFAASVNMSKRLRSEFSVPDTGLVFNAVSLTSPVCYMASRQLGFYTKKMLGKADGKPYDKYRGLDDLLAVGTMPPCFIISSTGDYIAKKQCRLASELMGSKGIDYKFMYWKKTNGKNLPHVFSVTAPEAPESMKAIDSMLLFFQKYTKNNLLNNLNT